MKAPDLDIGMSVQISCRAFLKGVCNFELMLLGCSIDFGPHYGGIMIEHFQNTGSSCDKVAEQYTCWECRSLAEGNSIENRNFDLSLANSGANFGVYGILKWLQ